MLVEVHFFADNSANFAVVLGADTLQLQLVLLPVGLFLQVGDLLIIQIDQVLRVYHLDSFAEVCCEACVLLFVSRDARLEVLQVAVKKRRHEVVVHVLERLRRPSSRLQIRLVQQIEMVLHLLVRHALVLSLAFAQVLQHLLVLLLRVLHVGLVTHGRIQVHHVLADQRLHLQRVEELLVVHHVTECLLVLLDLGELDEEHVVHLVKVLAHVVDSYASRQLEVHRLNPAIEFALELTNLAIVLFVSLRVLIQPVLAVLDSLVHTCLQVAVALLLALHLGLGLSHLLGHVGLGAKHDILHLLQVFFVLVELFFEGHGGVNLLLQVDLRLVDLLLRLLELLPVVRVDRLKFLLLSTSHHKKRKQHSLGRITRSEQPSKTRASDIRS